jgi:hypothetical protein
MHSNARSAYRRPPPVPPRPLKAVAIHVVPPAAKGTLFMPEAAP